MSHLEAWILEAAAVCLLVQIRSLVNNIAGIACFCSFLIREGCGKSKWKFKMAFAMKGGGVETGLECHIPILKNDFC